MKFEKKAIFITISLEIILQVKQYYYISFELLQIDDCLTKIYFNNNSNEILYEKPSEIACSWRNIPNKTVLFQYEFIFGDEFYFEISDWGGHHCYITVNTRINEYLILPELQKFWKCLNCRTDDGNYIYDSNKNAFYFYKPNNDKTSSYFYIYFKINSEEELINLNYIVDKNYYTLNQSETSHIYLNDFDTEITLIDFKNKTNFFVTHNKAHIIPFETIYFQILLDENITHKGKIMGYNFISKRYEELYNNSYFIINEEYSTLNYTFSSKEKNSRASHIKIYIMTYNSPLRLNLSQTVSNLGIFEYYICQEGYNACDDEFYLNCISEFKCYKHCPDKIINNDKCNYCHPDCNKCDETFNENNTNCLSCSSPDKYLQYGNCISECKNGYFNDTIEDNIIKKCICDYENCQLCSLESLNNNNSCISCNKEKGYFPLDVDININNDNKFIKCYKLKKGYYLDITDSLYKKCYDSCKYCDKNGSELIHNCLECKNNYIITITYEKYKNCDINCPYYYLDDNTSELFCTKEKECTGKYNKLIFGTNQCIDDCTKINRYKFRNICYTLCPEGSIKSENKSFSCDTICNEENKFELIEK